MCLETGRLITDGFHILESVIPEDVRADQQLYNYLGGDNQLNYYPDGQLQPGMTWENSLYRYGYNTQERSDEIYGPGNFYTAEFWEYDTRIWRRWNMDPMGQHPSPYLTFSNNPVLHTDWDGGFDTKFGAWLYKLFHGGHMVKNEDNSWTVNRVVNGQIEINAGFKSNLWTNIMVGFAFLKSGIHVYGQGWDVSQSPASKGKAGSSFDFGDSFFDWLGIATGRNAKFVRPGPRNVESPLEDTDNVNTVETIINSPVPSNQNPAPQKIDSKQIENESKKAGAFWNNGTRIPWEEFEKAQLIPGETDENNMMWFKDKLTKKKNKHVRGLRTIRREKEIEMKNFKRSGSLILILWGLISCSDNKTKTTYHSNGQKESVIEYKGELRNGTAIWFDTLGYKLSQGSYLNGILEGEYTEYYPSGKISLKGPYKNGKQEGVFFEYHEDGGVKSIMSFKNDAPSGYFIYYYPNGAVKMSAFFKEKIVCYIKYDSSGVETDRQNFTSFRRIESDKKEVCYELIYYSGDSSGIVSSAVEIKNKRGIIRPKIRTINSNVVKVCLPLISTVDSILEVAFMTTKKDIHVVSVVQK